MTKTKMLLLGLAAAGAILLTAGATIYILRSLSSTNQPSPGDNNNTTPDQAADDGIDAEKNKQAQGVESEAEKLMESNPQEAAKKYEEAAKLYSDAGNDSKSADMSDNAQTAASMTPPEELEFGEPVITR